MVRRVEERMIPYQDEKRDNAICFFAKEHRARAGTALAQTYLYKYLAFLDFLSVEKTGTPSIGLEYRAMKMGPVPPAIYNMRHCLKTPLFEFVDEGSSVFTIKAKGEPNLDYFSPFEIDIMMGLVTKYAKNFGKATEISEDSHKQIKAWKKTFDKTPNGIIDYILTFDIDLKNKPEKDLGHSEKCYLTYVATKHASKCSRAR
jgi:hypothetical protein